MRALILLVLCLVAAAAAEAQQPVQVTVAASYQLGEDDPGAALGAPGANPTVDEIGSTPLGKNGAPVYALGAADRGLGMAFTANQSYSSGTDVITTPSNFSIEAWVRPTATGGFGNIVRAGNISITRDPDGSIRGAVSGFSTGSSAPVPLNAWTHVAIARDGTSRLLIVNGTIVSSTAVTDGTPPSGGTYVGGDAFAGTIDEVRLLRIVQGTFNVNTLNVRRLAVNASGTGATPTATFDPPGGNYPIGMVVRATISVPYLNQVASVDPACAIVTQSSTQVVCDLTMNDHVDLSVVTAPYTPTTKHLTITRTGGSGTDAIVSTPAGIDCGATCEADFAESDPAVPSTFIDLGVTVTDDSVVSVAGADAPLALQTSPTRVNVKVILGSNRTVAFTFSPAGVVTTAVGGTGSGHVTSSPAGLDCGSTCSFTFPGYSSVTLTAAPSPGSTFTRWDTVPAGACPGTGSCTLTIGANAQQVTAVFDSVITGGATWRMGEDDAGAVSGGPVAATTVAATGGIDLARNGGGATYVPGPDGQGLAMNFDGVTYFSSATLPLTVNEEFGVTLWYKPPPGPPQSGGARTIAHAGRGCCSGMGIFREVDGTYFGLVGGNYTIGQGHPAATPQEWTHLAFIRTGGRAKFYVNGQLVDDQPFGTGAPADVGIGIGATSDGGSRVAGSVDDVRFFRVVGAFTPDVLNVRRIDANATGTGALPTVAFDPPGAAHLPGTLVRVTITAAPLTDLVSVNPACAIVTQSAAQIVCDAVMNDNLSLDVVRVSRAAQLSTVTVVRTGSIADPVVSTPAGLNCPPACSAQFPESDPNDQNTWLTLAVTPSDGSLIRFLAADGTLAPTAPPGVVASAKYRVSPNRTIPVDAVQPGAVLINLNGDGRVVSSPAGLDCPGTCVFTFPAYYPVTLTATGQNGQGFAEWQGTTCTGSTQAACTFTPGDAAPRVLTARFTLPAFVSLAYWRFGEDDGGAVAGNGAGGTQPVPGTGFALVGYDGAAAYAEGVAGRGLSMRFQGGRFLGSPGSLKPVDESADFGVSVWIKPDTADGATRTIYGTGNPDAFGTTLELTPDLRLVARSYGNGFTITSPSALPPGLWSHAAMIRIGAVKRLYVNGVEAGSSTDALNAAPYNFAIGRILFGDQHFAGSLDDLRFFRIEGGFDPLQLDVRRLGTSTTGTGTAPTITLSPPGDAYPTGTTVRVTIDAAPFTDLVSVNPACVPITQTTGQVVCDVVMNDSVDLAVVRQARSAVTTTLTVARTGSTTDPIVSTPAGIHCPPTCSAQFTESDLVDENGWVTLAVTPTDGSFVTFVTAPDRTLAPSSLPNVTLSARYRAIAPARTVTVDASPTGTVIVTVQGDGRVVSSPPGLDCPGACSFAFKAYYPVTLTATGQNGRVLYSWQGAECASASGTACTFTPVDATARAITASFALPFDVVAHYRLGEMDPGAAIGVTGNATTVDSSGRNLDLTRVGTPQYVAGAVGNGIGAKFAPGQRYESTTLALDDVRDFGIEAWVLVPPTDDQQFGLITMNGDITYTGYGYGLYRYGNRLYGANAPGSGTPQSGWTHVAMVQTGLRTKLYINGVLDGDQEYGDQFRPSLGDPAYRGLYIGDDRTAQSVGATVDEVRYFRFVPGGFNVASLNVRRLAATVTGPAPTITYSPDAKAWPTGTTVRVTIAAASGSQVLSFNPACAVVTQTATQVTCDIALASNADLAITTGTPAKIAQSITFGLLADRDLAATPFTVSATASSTLAVTFTSTTPDKCTLTGNSVALLATGICTIRASQAGDATFDPAPDVERSFTITSGPPQVALTVTRAGAGAGAVSGTGIDCGSDCTETYALGTVVTLVAYSGPGATFVAWDVPACGASPECVVTMDTAKSVQATFGAHTPARPRIDLNGDGRADILIRNADGRVAVWLMNGLSITSSAEIFPAGTAWQVAHIADLNGDGKADLVWQHPDGRITVYLMDGTTATLKQNLLPAGGGWTVTQAADLDGDGKADLVFQNTDGTIAVYLMDGVLVRSGATLLGPGSGWSVTKVGDFDGDGKSDVLWTHTDGRLAIWVMDGLTVKATNQVLNAGTGWSVTQVADLDGDGKSDLVWQNTNGTVAAWLMNGTAMGSGLSLLGPGTGWSITHVGDFDNDGKSDVLWSHADGRVAIWLMDGLGVKFYQQILNGGSGWSVKRVQDVDGDGKADIVWQNTDGRVAIWLMNGAAMISGSEILGPGTGWTVGGGGSP